MPGGIATVTFTPNADQIPTSQQIADRAAEAAALKARIDKASARHHLGIAPGQDFEVIALTRNTDGTVTYQWRTLP